MEQLLEVERIWQRKSSLYHLADDRSFTAIWSVKIGWLVFKTIRKMFFDIVGIVMAFWLNIQEANVLTNLVILKSLLF